MDPVSTVIITAIVAGIASGSKDVAKKAVDDGYNGLKGILRRKFSADSQIMRAVEQAEKNPDSDARKAVLKEEVTAANVDQDSEVLSAAKSLIEMMKADQDLVQTVNQVASGNYIAQASHGGTATVNVKKDVSQEE